MPRKNDWASRFGAKRRALDKAYCQAAERALAQTAKNERPPSAAFSEAPDINEESMRIARAFGRPLQ